MLTELYQAHPQKFDMIADAWLSLGAQSFHVSEFSQVVAQWPQEVPLAKPDIDASIELGGLSLGGLHVKGLDRKTHGNRLAAEAAFISQMILIEGELQALTAELIETQDHLLALYDVARSTRSQLKIPNLLDSLIGVLRRMIQVEHVFIWLDLPGHPVLARQFPHNRLTHRQMAFGFKQILKRRESVMSNGYDLATPLPEGIDSVLLCPIHIESEIMGVVALLNRVDTRFYSPDLKLLEAIVQQSEVHIENIMLQEQRVVRAKMRTEMELAHDVQLRLLPQAPPQFPGIDLAAGTLPALEVGGDFYDFIPLRDSAMVFLVGDVAGKGMPSALLMAMMRTAIRSAVRLLAVPLPQQILDRTNEDLYDDFTDVGKFATVFVAHYVPESQKLVYANAGHSPVIFCPRGGRARLLEADGTAVGVLPVNLAENQEIAFGEGDVLAIATDGFAEARNAAGTLFGYDRLTRLVEALADFSAQEIQDGIYETIAQFGNGRFQDDDQTLIVVKGREIRSGRGTADG